MMIVIHWSSNENDVIKIWPHEVRNARLGTCIWSSLPVSMFAGTRSCVLQSYSTVHLYTPYAYSTCIQTIYNSVCVSFG